MNTGVRIIKRGRTDGLNCLSLTQSEKTVRQSEREIAGTVKSWIVETTLRRRAEEQSALVRLKS
jgi:hypothetical protein